MARAPGSAYIASMNRPLQRSTALLLLTILLSSLGSLGPMPGHGFGLPPVAGDRLTAYDAGPSGASILPEQPRVVASVLPRDLRAEKVGPQGGADLLPPAEQSLVLPASGSQATAVVEPRRPESWRPATGNRGPPRA